MKTLLLPFILATSLWSTDVPTFNRARSCPGSNMQPVCTDFWRYDNVFIGTVTKLVNEPFPEGTAVDYQQYRKVRATVAVDEILRGNVGAEVVFVMGECYFEFIQNEQYLIYVNKPADGKFTLRRHGRTRLLSEAGEDMNFIRSLPDAPPGGRIFGTIYDHRGSVTLRVNNEKYDTNIRMPGVTVYLRSGDTNYQTISDAMGQYEFTRVPPGVYELLTDLPHHLSDSRHSGLTLLDKACMKVDMSIQASGEIRGRLVDSKGEPVDGAVVSIFSADGVTEDMFDRVKAYYMTRAETAKDGSFRFVRLRSGDYHLAVNMVDQERTKDSRVAEYPRVFYPGVLSFDQAKPITVGDGAQLGNIVIKLPILTPSPAPK